MGKPKMRLGNEFLNPSKMVQVMEKAKNSKPVPWNMTGTKQEPQVRAKPEAAGGKSHPGAAPNSSPAAFEGMPRAQGKPGRKGSGWTAPNTHPG